MHYVVAISLALAFVVGLTPLGRAADPLTLDITRKLGGQDKATILETRVTVSDEYRLALLREVGGTQYDFQPQIDGFLTIDLGNDAYVLAPWRLLKEAIAEKKQHIVKLIDGTEYTGTLLTEVRDDKANKYLLSAASRISVVKSGERVTAKNSDDRKPLSLVIDALQGKSLDVTFLGFYEVAPSIYINRYPNAKHAGEAFQLKVGDETLDGKVTLFSKLVFRKAEAKDEWKLTIESPTVKSIEGVFLPPTSKWGLVFETTAGCKIAVVNPAGTVSLSTRSASVDPALSSWDMFLDIAEKLYEDRAKGKHSELKDNEVVDFAPEFRAKMVTWEGKYEGHEKAGLSIRVKLDLPRPLSPPIVTDFRCAASDASKWSGVKEGATVRFSGKVAQVGTVWTELKLPTGEEKRVQMMTVEITDVFPSSDKNGK